MQAALPAKSYPSLLQLQGPLQPAASNMQCKSAWGDTELLAFLQFASILLHSRLRR